MEGGISPDVFTRLNSLHEGTCTLPNISIEEFHTRMQKIIKQEKSLSFFATNTKGAITVGILSEILNNARNVIDLWLEKVRPSEEMDVNRNDEKKINYERKVLTTGESGEVIARLIKDRNSNIVEAPKSSASDKSNQYSVVHAKFLIHFGITAALFRQTSNAHKVHESVSKGKSSTIKIGQRVAKIFGTENGEGGNIFRGVAKMKLTENNKDLYLIDGDEQHSSANDVNM